MLGNGSPFTVNPAVTTTYYARALNTNTGCWSAGCGNVSVNVNSLPGSVTAFGGGTYCTSSIVTASGGTGGTIYWQGTTSGGTSTASASTVQTITSSGTYYFRPYNNCGWGTQGSVTVTINNVPNAVSVNGGGAFCSGLNATLSASGGTGGTIYWQGTTSGGTSTLSAITSKIVSSTGIYYFRAYNACGWSNEGSATVTINSLPEEPSPVATPSSICLGGTSTLSASVTNATIYWYNGSCNGTVIGSGNTLAVSPTTTTTYYARAYNNATGCWSTDCEDVTVTVGILPTPVPTASPSALCGTGSSTLTASVPGATIYWYSGSCGTNLLGSGNTLVVSPTSTTTYFARAGNGSCSPSYCGTVTITVDHLIPQTINGSSPLCIGSTATWTSTTPGGIWTSSTPAIAIVDPVSGLVSGISAGTAVITYTVASGSCVNTATKTITISAPILQTISGTSPLCIGSSATWTSTSTGGAWSSSVPAIATINSSSGLINGISAGTSVITYSVSINGCMNTATRTVSVSAPTAQTINGTTPLCVGSTATWTSTTSGGTWTSSSPATATINAASGLLSGVVAGTSLITYSVSEGGCVNTATKTVTITSPVTQSISGTTPLCIGSSSIWTSTTTGGSWSSSTPGIASANISTGNITGISAGNAVITYSVTTAGGCINTATKTVTVTSPILQTITGTTPLCTGSATTWTSTTTGGSWSSSISGVATINAVSGLINGITAGSSIITYSVTSSGGCVNTATKTITITAPVNQTISGSTPICTGSGPTWTATTSGGTWASGNTGVAIINASTGVVTGVSAGTSLIAYTVTTTGGCVNTATRTISVANNVSATISGGTTPVCYNTSPGIFTATGSGGYAGYTYQWYKAPSTLLNNATNSTYTPGDMTVAAGYYCEVTGTCGTANTGTVNISVYPEIIASLSGGSSPICDKTNPGIFTTTASGGIGTYTYQWYKTTTGIVNGATNSTYNPGIMSASTGFYCMVTSGTCPTVSTPVFNVIVVPWVATPAPITIISGIEPACMITDDTTTTTYFTTAANSTGFHWSISNSAAGSIDSATGVMTWANGFYGTVDIQVIAYGCGGPSAQVTRTVGISSCGPTHTISGKTRYAGKALVGSPAPSMPHYNPAIFNINNVIVILKSYPAGVELARDTSNNIGVFQFNNLSDGMYLLSYDKYTLDSMQWGNGVDAIDVSLIKYNLGTDTLIDSSRNFSSKYKKASNVDNNSLINTIDIARIKSKIGDPNSVTRNFPKGNWVALDTLVTLAGSDLNVTLQTICYGDYNASSSKYKDSVTNWNGLKSTTPEIIATSDEMLPCGNSAKFDLPLRISAPVFEFSALGLELNYDYNNYELVHAFVPRSGNGRIPVKINPTFDEMISSDKYDLVVTDENGTIRVVYATTNSCKLEANEEIIVFGFRIRDMFGGNVSDFTLSGTGVIGDQYGEINYDAFLIKPKLFRQGNIQNETGLYFTGYPNPVKDNATLTYTIPEDGTVTIKVYNAIGDLVDVILANEKQLSGSHDLTYSPKNLPAGMYTFKLDFTGFGKSHQLILKLLH